VVSPNFLRTMDTRLLAGRDFDSRDSAEAQKAAIVNEAMARYFLGSPDAVRRSFQVTGVRQPLTVVGVVEDARYQSLREPAPPIVYLPSPRRSCARGPRLRTRPGPSPGRCAGLWRRHRTTRCRSGGTRGGGYHIAPFTHPTPPICRLKRGARIRAWAYFRWHALPVPAAPRGTGYEAKY